MATVTETFKFKKGQRLHLDDIYFIQTLGGGDWWQPAEGEREDSDNIVCVEDITIEISTTR
ncbi:MAG: hypothetical protein RIB80_04885 [Rhodospirillales bacterium]